MSSYFYYIINKKNCTQSNIFYTEDIWSLR